MALAFRSATEAGTGSAAASLAVNVPSGVQDGDHLVLFGVTADGDDGGFNTLTGWTEEVDAATFNTGGSAPSPPGMSVWRRIASSEPASYTITPTAGSTGICAKMIAVSGGDETTQWDVAEQTATGDGSNADPPSITPVTDGALTIVAAFWDSTNTVWSAAPSGYTDSDSLGSVTGNGGGNGCTCAIAHRNSVIDPAAAENPAAFSSSAEQWGAVTVALRPAPEGITSVTPDEFDMDEADVDVASAALFGASQGSSDVYLSPNDLLSEAGEVDITAAVNTWGASLINLDLTQLSAGTLDDLHTMGPGARFLIVNVGGVPGTTEYFFPITLHRPIAFVMSLGAGTPGSTTQRLTGLTGTFAGGRFEEAVNPSATTTNVADDGNREDAWSAEATTKSRDVTYVGRVLYGGQVPDTITQTPTITVTSSTTGTAVQTLPALTQTGTGVEEFTSTGASTLPSVGQAGTAFLQPEGVGDQTLAAVTQAGTGVEEFTGTAAQTLAAVTQAGAGLEEFIATGASALPAMQQSGVGLEEFTSTGDQTLPSLTQAGAALLLQIGTGIQILPGLEQSGTGLEEIPGAADQTLPGLTQNAIGTGADATIGNGVLTLPATTQVGAGATPPAGIGTQTLPALAQSGAGLLTEIGTGAQVLPATQQDGAGELPAEGTAAQTLPAATQLAAGVEIMAATGVQALPAAIQAGAGLTVPVGVGAQTAPALTQQGAGLHTVTITGSAVQTLPIVAQAGAGVMQPVGSAAQTLPATVQAGAAELVFAGTGAQVLGPISQSGAGLLVMAAVADQLLPGLTQVGNAIILPAGVGAQILPAILQSAVGQQAEGPGDVTGADDTGPDCIMGMEGGGVTPDSTGAGMTSTIEGGNV